LRLFNEAGEFVAPVAMGALLEAITTYGFDRRPGGNR